MGKIVEDRHPIRLRGIGNMYIMEGNKPIPKAHVDAELGYAFYFSHLFGTGKEVFNSERDPMLIYEWNKMTEELAKSRKVMKSPLYIYYEF